MADDPCPACNGTGIEPAGQQCQSCLGKGYKAGEGYRWCVQCGGTGETAGQICSACLGTMKTEELQM